MTWQPVKTKKSGRSEYTAVLKHPRLQHTTGAVTLRTEGVDAAGNTITNHQPRLRPHRTVNRDTL
ncbi:hypothetical protein EV652_102404 [Kribbella steppae]|uniref:Uncharacterized protein n=1 Tax=Kribbella steppae TaxID=2512223 RepID=A0A4R2HUR3_9ACTN|nr:hypothetical protein EV652_102404 [Kribbella steppae]